MYSTCTLRNYNGQGEHLPNLSNISLARSSSTENFSITRHKHLNGLSLFATTILLSTAHKTFWDFWVGVSPQVPKRSFTTCQSIRLLLSNSPANLSKHPWMASLRREKNSLKTRCDRTAAELPKNALEQVCLSDSSELSMVIPYSSHLRVILVGPGFSWTSPARSKSASSKIAIEYPMGRLRVSNTWPPLRGGAERHWTAWNAPTLARHWHRSIIGRSRERPTSSK